MFAALVGFVEVVDLANIAQYLGEGDVNVVQESHVEAVDPPVYDRVSGLHAGLVHAGGLDDIGSGFCAFASRLKKSGAFAFVSATHLRLFSNTCRYIFMPVAFDSNPAAALHVVVASCSVAHWLSMRWVI